MITPGDAAKLYLSNFSRRNPFELRRKSWCRLLFSNAACPHVRCFSAASLTLHKLAVRFLQLSFQGVAEPVFLRGSVFRHRRFAEAAALFSAMQAEGVTARLTRPAYEALQAIVSRAPQNTDSLRN